MGYSHEQEQDGRSTTTKTTTQLRYLPSPIPHLNPTCPPRTPIHS